MNNPCCGGTGQCPYPGSNPMCPRITDAVNAEREKLRDVLISALDGSLAVKKHGDIGQAVSMGQVGVIMAVAGEFNLSLRDK